MAEGFNSKSLAVRAQKKILSKMTSKYVAKAFIDDTSGRLLDNLYRMVRDVTGIKKLAEKHTKDLIKTIIKIDVLFRNDQFDDNEHKMADGFKKKFRTLAMAAVSFYEVDFSFDKNFLLKEIDAIQVLLTSFLQRHLTEKSLTRIDNCLKVYREPGFLEAAFNDPKHRALLGRIVDDLNKLLENNLL